MARLNVIFGDIKVKNAVGEAVQKRIYTKLLPIFEKVCQWYKQQVASMNYVYYDGYPHAKEVLSKIILEQEPEISVVLISNERIRIEMRLFDDSLGGELDKQTTTALGSFGPKKSPKAPELGWWRFFEQGASSNVSKNFGSTAYGFAPIFQDGVIVKGKMIKLGPNSKLKPHPGVRRIGMFEKTWDKLGDEFVRRIRAGVVEALSS